MFPQEKKNKPLFKGQPKLHAGHIYCVLLLCTRINWSLINASKGGELKTGCYFCNRRKKSAQKCTSLKMSTGISKFQHVMVCFFSFFSFFNPSLFLLGFSSSHEKCQWRPINSFHLSLLENEHVMLKYIRENCSPYFLLFLLLLPCIRFILPSGC